MRYIRNEKYKIKMIKKLNIDTYIDREVLASSNVCTFNSGEDLIEIDIVSDNLFILISGEIIILSQNADGKLTCVNYQPAYRLIGESASLWQKKPTNGVRALTECECISINLLLNRERLLNDVNFLRRICFIQMYRLNTCHYMTDAITEPTEVRLARFILSNELEECFSMKLTTVALVLNTSYRHLLRLIKKMCDNNMLKKDGKRYRIIRREQLQNLVYGDKRLGKSMPNT